MLHRKGNSNSSLLTIADCHETNKDTSPFALLARAPTFRRSSAWRGFLLRHTRQDHRLRPKLLHCLKIVQKICVPLTEVQRYRLSPHETEQAVLFPFLARYVRHPFLQFSTAVSLVSNFYSCIPNTFAQML